MCTRVSDPYFVCSFLHTASFHPLVLHSPKRDKSFLPSLLLMKAQLSVDGVEGRGQGLGKSLRSIQTVKEAQTALPLWLQE